MSGEPAGGNGRATSPLLVLRDVEVRYGKRVALSGVSATIPGGAVGLLGPNGAGKSSLLKALLGLVPLAQGEATILGRDVRRRGSALRRRIGYMPEREAAFAALTGFQATWYAGRLSGMPDADARRRAHEVLLFAGMEEARYREVSTYSTGMRQRIKLAQALVHDPDLVLLDEPTNGLDPAGRLEMLALIRTISRSKGIHVILSSHLLRDVEEVCESVAVLDRGRLVRFATLAELRRATADALHVTVAGEAAAFRAACERRGLAVCAERQLDFELRLADGQDARVVAAAALESGTYVRRLLPVRVTLEEALLEVLGSKEG